MPHARTVFSGFLAALVATALIACGGDEGSGTESSENEVSAEQAIAEIGKVRSGLQAAGEAYASGDAEGAEELATDAYLEHFELVEGPLGEVDEELNEELEDMIREELRDLITSGANASEVDALIKEIDGDLNKAEAKLGGSSN